MAELGHQQRFAVDMLAEARVGRNVRMNHLDGHQPAGVDVPAQVHMPHAALAERLDHLVPIQQNLTYHIAPCGGNPKSEYRNPNEAEKSKSQTTLKSKRSDAKKQDDFLFGICFFLPHSDFGFPAEGGRHFFLAYTRRWNAPVAFSSKEVA
jgi:hypothetical protein